MFKTCTHTHPLQTLVSYCNEKEGFQRSNVGSFYFSFEILWARKLSSSNTFSTLLGCVFSGAVVPWQRFWNVNHTSGWNVKWNANVVNTNSRSAVSGLSAWRVLCFWCVHLFFEKKIIKPALGHCSLLPAQLKEVSNLFTFTQNSCELLASAWGQWKTLHQHFLQKFIYFLAVLIWYFQLVVFSLYFLVLTRM